MPNLIRTLNYDFFGQVARLTQRGVLAFEPLNL
jgi:hypothetical protein